MEWGGSEGKVLWDFEERDKKINVVDDLLIFRCLSELMINWYLGNLMINWCQDNFMIYWYPDDSMIIRYIAYLLFNENNIQSTSI